MSLQGEVTPSWWEFVKNYKKDTKAKTQWKTNQNPTMVALMTFSQRQYNTAVLALSFTTHISCHLHRGQSELIFLYLFTVFISYWILLYLPALHCTLDRYLYCRGIISQFISSNILAIIGRTPLRGSKTRGALWLWLFGMKDYYWQRFTGKTESQCKAVSQAYIPHHPFYLTFEPFTKGWF